MPRRTALQQFSFTSGMLDPAVEARSDVRAYFAGARDLTNVLGMAQGGVATRGGFRHVAEIEPPEGDEVIRLASFTFALGKSYLIAFSHQRIDVFQDGALNQSLVPDPEVPGDADRFFTSEELADVSWTQSLDTMILVHPDHPPRRLLRQHDGEDEDWVLGALALTNTPTFNFRGLTLGTASVSISGATATITSTDGTDFEAIDLSAGAPTFWVRLHGGLIRVTGKTSATVVEGTVVQSPEETTAVEPGLWSVEEDTWSDQRGWPRSVNLFQGRLYFGQNRARPQTIWGSRAGSFFDFGTTADVLDDEAVELTLDNDQIAAVEQLFVSNDFLAMTSGGVYACAETPVTPANFLFRRQSELPASPVRPVELDGVVVFIRSSSDSVRATCNELVFDDARQVLVPQDLGLLAGGLIDAPVDMTARQGTELDGANHLMLANSDGSVAVLNTRRAQNIAGWTRLSLGGGGLVKAIAAVGARIYVVVSRELSGSKRSFIECLEPDSCLDSSVLAAPVGDLPSTDWNGLDFLEGTEVQMFSEGLDLGTATVVDGTVTTMEAVSNLEVGFPFDWTVETMPLEAELTDGTFIGNRHRLARATVRTGTAGRFAVNGRDVEPRTFWTAAFGSAGQSAAKLATVRLLGWSGGRGDVGATVRVTGKSTEPASILSITAEVTQ
ncbi:MAG: hypothetical protein P1U37_09015 [Minwuia sp.]|nr:hypothetical protein [Minwuia sp.]